MDVLKPVNPVEHTGVSVHVEHALKVVFVQVLQTADVEIEQLVGVAKVLVCHLVKIVDAQEQRSPFFVPIPLHHLEEGVVLDWVDHPDDSLVLCRPKNHFHLNTCVLMGTKVGSLPLY